jgi:hypothetical protein
MINLLGFLIQNNTFSNRSYDARKLGLLSLQS